MPSKIYRLHKQARRCQLEGEDVDMFIRRHQSLRTQLESRSPTMALKRKSSLSEPPFEDACSTFDEPAVKERKEELPMEDAIDMTLETTVNPTTN